MKRVILTGASGFIGIHTISFLLKKYEVCATYHDKENFLLENYLNNNIEDKNSLINLKWYRCNILDPIEQKKLFTEIRPTHLLHFAWYTEHGKYWASIENIKWVQASLNLLMNFSENGGKRIVLAGTCAEYDWNNGYCSETITPLKPSSLYGICKNSLRDIAEKFLKQTGISYVWGRIFHLYGPFENSSRIIPYVINSLLSYKYANCTDGNQIRDFLYVKDVASAFVSILDNDVQGCINVASGQPIYLKDVISKIAEKLDKRDLIKFGEIKTSEGDPPILLADIDRLRKELGWKPKYTLDRGLDETIKWWKENKEKLEKT